VTNSDGKEFVLIFVDKNSKFYASEKIQAGCSASSLKGKIKGFYKQDWGCEPSVTLKCYDTAGTETDCSTGTINEYRYTIETPRSISAPSTTGINAVNVDSKAKVTVKLPKDVKLSNAPLSGSFFLECYDLQGNAKITADMAWSSNAGHVYNNLISACPHLRDNIEVRDG